MQKITRFTAEERDNLTAYLDGELEESAALVIEKKLAQSEVARREVEILSRTWDMLNLLPKVGASEEFTQRTISFAQQSDSASMLARSDRLVANGRRGLMLAVWLAIVALSALGGYHVTRNLVPDQAQALVEQLPIVENIDQYREVGDVEYLQLLRSSHLFDEEPQDGTK